MSEAIRSGQPRSMEEFQAECQVRIRRTEDAIKRLCKKHYPEFMQASECMEHFKVGLTDVKDRLKDIQARINDVDKSFYSQAQYTMAKQEEVMELAGKQRRLATARKFIVRVKKLD